MKKKEAFISERIKDVIQKVLLPIPQVIRKFQEKTEYLLVNPVENIPDEHNISKWTQFLPPLVQFKIKGLMNVTSEFKSKLLSDLKIGSTSQREKILVVESKIIQYSLAIQEKIQEVINKKKLILTNSANEPFVENACCNEKPGENAHGNSNSAIDYFIKEEPEIKAFNDIVQNLSNVLEDIHNIAEAPTSISKENTKNIYPPLSNEFSEDTIYRAFILYCRFTSLIPIAEDLLILCSDKPEYISKKDSVAEMIAKLKRDGRNYTNESFMRLMQIVNRKNIVNLTMDKPVMTPIQSMTSLLETFSNENEEVVYPALQKLLNQLLDTFDVAITEDNEEMRTLKNHLYKTNQSMKSELADFLKKHNTLSGRKLKNIGLIIDNVLKWNKDGQENVDGYGIPGKKQEKTEKEKHSRSGSGSRSGIENTISDDKTYQFIQFIKSYIHNILKTFPNIILNKVDYDKIQIPNYWGLSQNHGNDIKKIVKDHYVRLRQFYSENVLSNLLSTIQNKTKNLLLILETTPYLCDIEYKNKKVFSIFDKRTCILLFEQYFLLALMEYKNLTENDSMLFFSKNPEELVDLDDVFTIEDLEEKEQKTDVVNEQFEKEISLQGNKRELQASVANLIIVYLSIMRDHKDIVDKSYDNIMDKVFKIAEREKDTFTDRLKEMTDEERNVDTILKINKLGVWSKGLQKGLTSYVKETYDDERDLMDKITEIERKVRKGSGSDVVDGNVEQYIEDYLQELDADLEAEREAYDISNMTEDFYDGNFESDEVEDYEDHY
jgi:hypothetical protein